VEKALPRSRGGGGVAQTMYTHVTKCKDDIMKGEKKKDLEHFKYKIKIKI
jgi:hypothetical protein